jgi:CheY-like chemotaxis protein
VKKPTDRKSIIVSVEANRKSIQRGRLLIVEDSESSRAMICHHLRDEQFDLEEAENGAVAIEKVKAAPFGLILMDIQMPMMDGYEAMRRIRQWEQTRGLARTPIIAFTASSFEEDVQEAIKNGADLHVSKPVKKEALASAIKSLIRSDSDEAGLPGKHSVAS